MKYPFIKNMGNDRNAKKGAAGEGRTHHGTWGEKNSIALRSRRVKEKRTAGKMTEQKKDVRKREECKRKEWTEGNVKRVEKIKRYWGDRMSEKKKGRSGAVYPSLCFFMALQNS